MTRIARIGSRRLGARARHRDDGGPTGIAIVPRTPRIFSSLRLSSMIFMMRFSGNHSPAWRRPARKISRLTIAVVLVVAGALPGAAQNAAPAAAFPKPDRPVADIISPIWRDEAERDKAGEPAQLVRLLGVKAGMTVADIGAGSGYYVVRLSPVVGAGGRVIAEDVMPDYLQNLRRRVHDLGLANVAFVEGEAHDPKLPANALDLAILVHMYHEIAQPYALLYNLVPAFKPGARVGIVDAFAPTAQHGTPPDLLRCELQAVGYHETGFDRLTGSDAYLAVFAPPSVVSRPRPDAIVACKAQ